jgi:DNA-binding transcriptional LysR family regulator
VAPTTVSRERWLAFPPRLTAAREPHTATLAERLAANGLTASEVIHVDSLTAQKRMVEAGFGLALLPESAVVEELRARTLCRLRIPRMRAMVPVALLHRRRAFQSSATRKLAALLSESLHSRM